jgi:hypothetical protein
MQEVTGRQTTGEDYKDDNDLNRDRPNTDGVDVLQVIPVEIPQVIGDIG